MYGHPYQCSLQVVKMFLLSSILTHILNPRTVIALMKVFLLSSSQLIHHTIILMNETLFNRYTHSPSCGTIRVSVHHLNTAGSNRGKVDIPFLYQHRHPVRQALVVLLEARHCELFPWIFYFFCILRTFTLFPSLIYTPPFACSVPIAAIISSCNVLYDYYPIEPICIHAK